MSGIFSNGTARSIFNNRLIEMFFLALATLFVAGYFAFQTVLQLSREYQTVTSAYEVIRELDEITAGVTFGQTELRTFYILEDSSYLKTYRSKNDAIRKHITRVKEMVVENDDLLIQLFQLETIIKQREEFNKNKLSLVIEQGQETADKRYPVQESQAIVRRIDSLVMSMEASAKKLLTQRTEQTNQQSNRTLLMISFGGIISVVIFLVVFLFLLKEIQQRTKAEQKIRENEKQLTNFLEEIPAGIHIFSANGDIYFANQAANKILGQGVVEGANKDNITEVYGAYIEDSDTIYPAEKTPTFRALRGERSSISDVEIRKSDGNISLYATGSPIYDSDGKLQYAMVVFIDITEQKRIQKQLLESEERYRQIIENATDIIYRTDNNGNLTYVNPVGLKIFGYTEQEAMGMHFLEVVDIENLDTVKRYYLRQALTKTKNTYYEFKGVTKKGKQIILGQNVQLLMSGDKINGFLAVARDISEKKRYEMELEEAKTTAETATVAKSQFLATMSHEIRTPMNGVIGMTDLLLQTELTKEQKEYTEIIRTSGETLLTLINDILDFSKIESGNMEMEKRPVEIQSLIEETFDLVARRAVEKRLDLIYLIDPSTPSYIIGDSVRLRQILLNLVSNALKFTEKGEVFVSVKEVSRQQNYATIQFSVRDTGIGIPSHKLDRLFQAFSQVDASTTRKYGGTGLGLVITKRLVELMDGNVWVESEEGKGSTFHFTIVVPTTSEADTPPKKYVRGKIPELLGKRILIVDDNETNINILSIQCTNWGMHPRATTSQQDALKWLKQNDPFDIAILDYHMPEMNGVDLARVIRNLRNKESLPIILFSSSGRNSFTQEENSLFAAVVLKPMKQSSMYSTLIDVFTSHNDLPIAPIQPIIQKVETLSPMIPLTILVAEDNIINQKLAIRLLKQLGYATDIAPNGSVVLEMIKRRAYDIILMDLHMPVMDGLETTKEILATTHPSTRPKIIAMTADAMSGDRERCIDAGMDDYISKPVRLEGLRDMLQKYGEIILEKKTIAQKSISADSAMYHRLNELLLETDKEFFLEFAQSFPAQSEECMQQVEKAWKERDTKQLIFATHKLRGLSLSFGANEVAEYCKFIEVNAEQNRELISEQSVANIKNALASAHTMLSDTIKKLGLT